MKVKELVKLLENVNPEFEVLVTGREGFAYDVLGTMIGTCSDGEYAEAEDGDCFIIEAD